MMKRITIALAAAAAVIAFALPASAVELDTVRVSRPSGASDVSWIAFAATPGGRVFKGDTANGEEAARRNARSECENATARTCASTISVPWQYDVTMLKCYRGGDSWVFMGASQQGNQYDYAISKAVNAGYGNCSVIAQY